MTRENWTALIENDLLPDFVISLNDEKMEEDFLLTRFKILHNLPMNQVDVVEVRIQLIGLRFKMVPLSSLDM